CENLIECRGFLVSDGPTCAINTGSVAPKPAQAQRPQAIFKVVPAARSWPLAAGFPIDLEGAKTSQSLVIMRKVYLFGEINNERSEKFIAQLHELFEESSEPITIYINSCGGSVTDA